MSASYKNILTDWSSEKEHKCDEVGKMNVYEPNDGYGENVNASDDNICDGNVNGGGEKFVMKI